MSQNYTHNYQFLEKLFQQYSIAGLSFDSNNIKKDHAFFAIKGKTHDGNLFIKEAFSKGAKIVLTDDKKYLKTNEEHIIYIENVRIALAISADIFYPKRPKIMVAATGTNGKSSVVSYCGQLYSLLGGKAATIGTLGIEYFGDNLAPSPSDLAPPSLTTLDVINFKKTLHNLAENNIDCVAFEASSHGLDQARLFGVKVQAACFTSFSQDHLDYHHNMHDYLLAKLRLFTENLQPGAIAVLNSEITQLDFIINYFNLHNIKFITVGKTGALKINNITQSLLRQKINFTFQEKNYNFETEIIGSFQASNLLIAAMLVHESGFDFAEIVKYLPRLTAVKGRLERITQNDSIYHIFIDYAHTPDSLEKTLNELKALISFDGRLKVIFGCGGERDHTKRELMGEIAAKIADEVIVTDDNPRNEDPAFIRQQIINGIVKYKTKYIEINDRKRSITQTIQNMNKDDILLIAGKGHEEYQIIGDKKNPFSDAFIARESL